MRTLPSWLGLLGTLALAGLPAPSGAQPIGSEFQVNTYTTGSQNTGGSNQYYSTGRVIAADASGHFVVVWQSLGQDGSGSGIFGQRYDSVGDPLGSEFRVNSNTTNSQVSPTVASDPEGNFVVVWESPDGSGRGIFGRRFDSGGGAQGAQFRINSFTSSNQHHPAVASNADGSFIVAWDSSHAGNNDIFARRYDSAGNALGTEFRVNSYTTSGQISPAVASDAAGNFVVVWYSYDYPPGQGQFGVFGQRYDDAGSPLGTEFRVSAFGAPPGISSDASGNFVVVWETQYGGPEDISGRRYDSGGVPLGPRFQVNTYTTSNQRNPKVASDEDGNFVVVWQSLGQDGTPSEEGVFGRRFDAAGGAQGSDFQVNSYTPGDQSGTSVAATGTNEFVAVWTSFGQDGSSYGVFGQRYDFSGGASTIHVGDLDGRAKNVGARWRAQVKTLVHDDAHSPLNGVFVIIDVFGVGPRSCTTTAAGQCEVSVLISDSVASLTFSVTNLLKTGFTYTPAANHDPDPDSDGTVIVVNQP